MTSNAHLLVVDDEPADLQLLSKVLGERGYVVHAARGGSAALNFLAHHRADLMLLDIRMPAMDGFEFLSRLESEGTGSATPVIFLSVVDDVDTKIRALRQGGVDYIVKPFHVEEVLARIAIHLDLHATLRRLAEQNAELRGQGLGPRAPPGSRDPGSAGGREPSPREAPPGRQRVLVVEDQAGVRQIALRILQRGGYEAQGVAEVEAACRLLDGGYRFDVILSDIVLPGPRDGWALRDYVALHYPDIPVVLMTGYSERALVEQNGVLFKPFAADALLAAIAKASARDA